MNDTFDSLPADDPTGPGTGFVLMATVGLCAVAGIAWAVAAFLHEGGIRICPDGGDEIWSRPSIGSYAPEVIIAGVGVALLFAVLRGAMATGWAAALALASVGSLIGYLAIDEYLGNTGLPDHYRCGDSYPGAGMPRYVAPALIVVYVLVFAWWRLRGRAAA
jgi:hypothetical protein